MSDLFKQALTVAGMIGIGLLVYIGTLIITSRFNDMLLRRRKFWLAVCGDRKNGPAALLAALALILITSGYLFASPWLLGAGFSTAVYCYIKYRETLKKDPFDDRD